MGKKFTEAGDLALDTQKLEGAAVVAIP